MNKVSSVLFSIVGRESEPRQSDIHSWDNEEPVSGSRNVNAFPYTSHTHTVSFLALAMVKIKEKKGI